MNSFITGSCVPVSLGKLCNIAERAWENLKFSCWIYKTGAFLSGTGLVIKDTSHTLDTYAFKKSFCYKFCYKGNINWNFS